MAATALQGVKSQNAGHTRYFIEDCPSRVFSSWQVFLMNLADSASSPITWWSDDVD